MSSIPQITDLLSSAIGRLVEQKTLSHAPDQPPQVQVGRSPEHGHFSSPVALSLASAAGDISPHQLAGKLLEALATPDWLERVEVAGAGYLNFFLRASAAASALLQVLEAGKNYGRAAKTAEKAQRILVEFVSSNPTGPLHIGHGRGAVVGDTLASLFAATGDEVAREYYINDRGRQSKVLALSACLRHFSLPMPQRAYQGDYVAELALQAAVLLKGRRALATGLQAASEAFAAEADDGAGQEALLDRMIQVLEQELGGENLSRLCDSLHRQVLDGIAQDAGDLNVKFDRWFHESSLYSGGAGNQVDDCVRRLLAGGHAERRDDGALWFLSSRFGDDKDRVLVRSNGEATYFASDIAYHSDKFSRGYHRVINVWGADHHGYEARLRGALRALGLPEEKLQIIYVQFVALVRDGQRIGMSTRSASYVPLRQLLGSNVPAASVRLMYLSSASVQQMEFDLQAAVARDRENPAYYIQYAHARICSLEEKREEKYGQEKKRGQAKRVGRPAVDAALLSLLTADREVELQKAIARFPSVIAEAAGQCEPHRLVAFLRDLAALFHSWYNAERMLIEDERLRTARLALCAALKQVFANGLDILGVQARASM